ncbi:MAG: oligosaccharide flippase family protein [Planctomycetes bacterium]|nr:oligosaccharide flippase family protein [Planctomycetota bacterium]
MHRRLLALQEALSSPARRGAVWTAVGYGGGQVLRFAGNIVLSRLLFPEAFGMTAIVGSILQALQLFSDIGIGPSIIQSSRGEDRKFLATAWTLQVVRGVVIWIAVCAAAIPIANFYNEPELAWIAPIGGLSVLVSGFASTKLFTANKNLQMGRLTGIELSSQAVGLVAQIGWALMHRSVWALVAGGMCISITKMVLSHYALPGTKDKFGWDRDAARSLIHFGRWIFFSTLLTYCVTQADRLVFGKLVPLDVMGDYSIAVQIAMLPAMGIGSLSLSIAFPHYSRLHNSGVDLKDTFHRTRVRSLWLAGWMSAGLIAGGQAAVTLLYDARYHDAGWIVQFLACGAWFFALEATNGAALLATGNAKWVAFSNGAKLVAMISTIPFGFAYWGFPGAVACYAGADVFKWIVSCIGIRRVNLSAWPRDIAYTAWTAATALAGAWAATTDVVTSLGRFWPAFVVFAVVTLGWMPLVMRENARIQKGGGA